MPLRYDSVDPEFAAIKIRLSATGFCVWQPLQAGHSDPQIYGRPTTPDFVYRIERQDADSVYLPVETKSRKYARRAIRLFSMRNVNSFDMLRRQKYQCRVCGSDQRAGGIFYDQWLD